MLRLAFGESEHVEGFFLHKVGDVVGASCVVASLVPLVAPGERFSSYIGHELKIGDFV